MWHASAGVCDCHLVVSIFSPSVKGKYYCVFIKCFHSIYMSIVYLQKKGTYIGERS